MDNAITYDRSLFTDELLNIIEITRDKQLLKTMIDDCLERHAKLVSLITFETNAFRMNIEDGKVGRI